MKSNMEDFEILLARLFAGVVSLLFVIGENGCKNGPPLPDASPATAITAEKWLEVDCEVGAQEKMHKFIRDSGNVLVSFFKTAYEQGPGPLMRQSIRDGTLMRYRIRQSFFANHPGIGILTPAAVLPDSLTCMSVADTNFVVHYKARAISGLGLIASDSAKAALGVYKADSLSPLHALIVSTYNAIP